jgi:dihydrofolate reductase
LIRAILAHDAYWGIGKNGGLPWPKNSGDLEWFKKSTLGCAVVMGRGTWDGGMPKPLPKRRNIVITNRSIDGVECYTLEQFKSRYTLIEQPIFIIGGATLVEQCLPIIDELWLNNVGGNYDCDTFLPKQKITEQFYPKTTLKTDFGLITTWVKRNETVSSST